LAASSVPDETKAKVGVGLRILSQRPPFPLKRSTSVSMAGEGLQSAARWRRRMKVDGSCHCGAIRYEAEIDPDTAGICHCTDCQALTGSAFRVTVATEEQKFRLTAGEPKTYGKTGDSGAKRLQAFCGNCGSPLYATSADDPADGSQRVIGIRVGTIRQRRAIRPAVQYWRSSALDWVPPMAHLETFAGDD
jgi:hypothetical protein